jgi:hypothetical protein
VIDRRRALVDGVRAEAIEVFEGGDERVAGLVELAVGQRRFDALGPAGGPEQ